MDENPAPILEFNYFSHDFEAELQAEVTLYELDNTIVNVDEDEKALYPTLLHAKLSDTSCESLVGFSQSVVEEIIQSGLVYLKRAIPINTIASQLKEKGSKVRTAIIKGVDAVSKCFVPFDATLGCPRLTTKLLPVEKERLTEPTRNSRFIIDGRNQRLSSISCSFEQRKKYFSHKLKGIGLSSQYIVNHEGFCLYVSPSMPCSNADISMYRLFKPQIMAGINELMTNIGDSTSYVYIMGDKGYRCEDCPELITLATGCNDITYNRYRILIENFFGRMIKVFRAAKELFMLSEERFDAFNLALAYLTNMHIKLSPLRQEEYKLLVVCYDKIEQLHRQKATKHKESQQKYLRSINNN
ncbi:hypothetical protein WA158_006958 [Blastocystis sp. Blastoise]